MCRKLGVTPGGYHAWLKRGLCQRKINDEALLEQIIKIHKANRELYGYPRIHQALKQLGYTCGRNRVARLMRENGIIAKMARRFKRHKHKHELFRSSTNLLLDREAVTAHNQVWVGDVTFIRVDNKWTYLSTVMDLYNREIIGWCVSKKNDAALVKETLIMAATNNKCTSDTIFHSDQGSVYASKVYRDVLSQFNLKVSMSRKGHCWDNAYMESFYHTLKTEMVYFMKFKCLTEAIAHIMDYIRYYNNERLHSSLGYITPCQMSKLVA